MSESTQNDPWAWFGKLQTFDDEVPDVEKQTLIDRVLPEGEREVLARRATSLAYWKSGTLERKVAREFGGEAGVESFKAHLAELPVPEQLDYVAGLSPRQKAVALELAMLAHDLRDKE
jgi:hypothetical protein